MQAFIFDFDGVMVDSERYWGEMDRTFFPAIAPGYTLEHAKNITGLGLFASYDFLVRELNLAMTLEEYDMQVSTFANDMYETKVALLPGLIELLKFLREQNIPTGIASSSRRAWIEPTLERLGIHSYFQTVCGSDDVNHVTKPAPDVYLCAAQKLNADPLECIAIEDSKNGIAAAKAAGMRCIGLRTTMNAEQDLSAADELVTRLFDVPGLLDM